MIKNRILVDCQKLENRLKQQTIKRENSDIARMIKHHKNHLGNDH